MPHGRAGVSGRAHAMPEAARGQNRGETGLKSKAPKHGAHFKARWAEGIRVLGSELLWQAMHEAAQSNRTVSTAPDSAHSSNEAESEQLGCVWALQQVGQPRAAQLARSQNSAKHCLRSPKRA